MSEITTVNDLVITMKLFFKISILVVSYFKMHPLSKSLAILTNLSKIKIFNLMGEVCRLCTIIREPFVTISTGELLFFPHLGEIVNCLKATIMHPS